MKHFILTTVGIAVIIMLISIYKFIVSFKAISDAIKDENSSKMKKSFIVYLVLLIFFAIAYILYAITWVDGDGISSGYLVSAILLLGSIFVYISMYYFKLFTSKLLIARINQTDNLTGVLNKCAVKVAVENAIITRTGGLAFMVLDLDNFKSINDNYGHMEGDEVIKSVAEIIRNVSNPEDIVGRFGGDEFVALFKNIEKDHAIEKAEAIKQKVLSISEKRNIDVNLGASIGIVCCSSNSPQTYEEMFAEADKAMYHSKSQGKNCVTDADNIA